MSDDNEPSTSAPANVDAAPVNNSAPLADAPTQAVEPEPITATPEVDPIGAVEPSDPAPTPAVEIPDTWADLHWKQVVALAKQLGAAADATFDDAKRIISDELSLRAVPAGDDGLVAVTKDGDTLRVHPTTVDAHKKAGWVLV